MRRLAGAFIKAGKPASLFSESLKNKNHQQTEAPAVGVYDLTKIWPKIKIPFHTIFPQIFTGCIL